jgi:hypothetical protein
MYTFKRKLVKAQGGKNLSETDSVVREGKFTLPDDNNTRISVQKPTTPRYVEIDEKDVVSGLKPLTRVGNALDKFGNKAETTMNSWKQKYKDRRDERINKRENARQERRAPYTQELDAIEQLNKDIKEKRDYSDFLDKQKRLQGKVGRKEDRLDNLTLSADKKKMLGRTRGQGKREEDASDDKLKLLAFQQEMARKQGRGLRRNENQRTSNADAEHEAKNNLIVTLQNQYLKTNDQATREKILREIDAAKNDLQYDIDLENVNDRSKNRNDRLTPLQNKRNRLNDKVYEDGQIGRTRGIFGKPNNFHTQESDSRIINTNSNVAYPQFGEILNYGQQPIINNNAEEELDEEEIDEDDVMLDNETEINNITFNRGQEVSEQEKRAAELQEEFRKKGMSQRIKFPNIILKDPSKPVETPTLFSMPRSKDDETTEGRYQDGGYLEEDFDYTEDVDIDDLNNYLRGGYLPKAQGGLGLPPKVIEPTQAEIEKWKNRIEEDNSNYYIDNEGNALGQLGTIGELDYSAFANKDKTIVPVATEANRYSSPYLLNNPVANKYTDKTNFGPEITTKSTSTTSDDYNPWKLHEPGNIIQDRAAFGPFGYNLSKYLERPMDRKVFHTNPVLRREEVTPDYTAVNEAKNSMMDTFRENSRSPQGFIANAINANMEMAKQKNQIAAQTTRENMGLHQKYLAEVNRNKEILDAKKQAAYNQYLQDEVTRESFGAAAIKNLSDKETNRGQMLNDERKDRIQIDTYLNQISKDYNLKKLPNGLFEVIHNNGTKAQYTLDELKEMDRKNKEQIVTDKANDIERKQKKLDDDTKKYEIEVAERNAAQAERDKAIKLKEEADAKAKTNKKYGGWLKEKPKLTKNRNRLYL